MHSQPESTEANFLVASARPCGHHHLSSSAEWIKQFEVRAMRLQFFVGTLIALAFTPCLGWTRETPARGLDIYFVDTEGGAATLLVTPAGESVLIDCGNPGSRDADRIYRTAKAAGLKAIDHLIISHWH